MKKKISAILSAFILAVLPAGAQALSSLLIPSDPESAAVAGTSAGRAAGAFAVDNNAAAISLSDTRAAVGAVYSLWAPETARNNIFGAGGFVRLGDRIGIGISGRYNNDRPVDISSASGSITGSFRPSEFSVSAAVSVRIVEGLSAAFTGKVFQSSIMEGVSGTAFGADISLAWKHGPWQAGAVLCNVGTDIKYGENSYPLPMLVKAGASWTAGFGLSASLEADYLFSGAFMAGLGLEYTLLDIVSIRAGYHYGDDSKGLASFASAGLGIRLAGLSLSAAYLTASPTLGNSLLVGIGYDF